MEAQDRALAEILNKNQLTLCNSYTDPLDSHRCEENKKLVGIWDSIIDNMISPTLVSVQPMKGIFDKISFYRYRVQKLEDGTIPEINLDLKTLDIESHASMLKSRLELDFQIEAETRRFKSSLNTKDNCAEELDREILSTILDGAKTAGNILEARKYIHIDLATAAQLVHRKSMRGPARWLIGNPKTLTKLGLIEVDEDDENFSWYESQKFIGDIYTDKVFPEDEILVGRVGYDEYDAGLVWSPLRIESNSGCMRIRHKITFVNPNFYWILKINT